ncbi:MAG: hypothetical protein JW816_01405 [Candidatus Buchananbacteria bacterium]|nr:hypothetical protein [Candidatus Buchananbacteria bacterium]
MVKKSSFKVFFSIFFLFSLLFNVNFVFAVDVPSTPAPSGTATAEDITPPKNQSGVTTLDNPLPSVDPRVIIGNIIKAILGLVGSLALLMFIYGGFLWVVAGGNEEKVSQGKKIIIWTTAGLALIFFSYTLVNFVVNAIVTGAA